MSRKKTQAEKEVEEQPIKQKLQFIMRDAKQRIVNLRRLLKDQEIEKVDKVFIIYCMEYDEDTIFDVKSVVIEEGHKYLIEGLTGRNNGLNYLSHINSIMKAGVAWEDLRRIPITSWWRIKSKDDCSKENMRILKRQINERKKRKKKNTHS